MLKEFKAFIEQGNVLDAAVGFVLGFAFKAIIDGIVAGILMPIVGYLTAGYDLNSLKIVLRPEDTAAGTPEVALLFGTVLQAIISFFIVAFVLFLLVKAVNKARERRKSKEAVAAVEEAAPADIVLLTEIRDLLQRDKA